MHKETCTRKQHRLKAAAAFLTAGLILLGVGCAGGQRGKTTPGGLDLSPERQTDWLPENSVAVMHLDVDAARELPALNAVVATFEPSVRKAIEQTHAMRMSLIMEGEEPSFVMLMAGDYTPDTEPGAKGQSSSKATKNGLDRWQKTPEGFWLVAKAPLDASRFDAPEKRQQRLSDKDWAKPPAPGTLLRAAVDVGPNFRAKMLDGFADNPAAQQMFRPAIEQLVTVWLEARRTDQNGLIFELQGAFEGARGANTAAFLLKAGVEMAKTKLAEQAAPGEDVAAEIAAPEGEGAASGNADEDTGEALGKEIGRRFAQKLVSEVKIRVEGTNVIASFAIDEMDLLGLRSAAEKQAAAAD